MFIQAVLLCNTGIAGFERIVQPTAVFAKAGSGVAMAAHDNLWLNPASSASLSSFRATLFYVPSPFQLSQLSHYGLIVAQPLTVGTISLGVHTLGFPLYRESNGSVTFARVITDDFFAGITLHAFHLAIQGYGSTTKFGTDIGGIFNLSKELSVGISLGNVNGADIGDGEEIPRTVTFGAVFRPVGSAVIVFDLIKDIRFPETYRVGLEFLPLDVLSLHAGIQGEPSRLFGGIGVTISPFTVHYGIGTHADLGSTHSIGVMYAP